jgi:hypothetical protein
LRESEDEPFLLVGACSAAAACTNTRNGGFAGGTGGGSRASSLDKNDVRGAPAHPRLAAFALAANADV